MSTGDVNSYVKLWHQDFVGWPCSEWNPARKGDIGKWVRDIRDPSGNQQFTVGTGGRSLYPLGKKPRPGNLLAVQNKSFGVIELTLRPGAYDYRWVGLPTDRVFQDQGTVACR